MMFKAFLLLALAATLTAQQEPGQGALPGKSVQEGRILAQFYQMRVARIQQTLGISEDRAKVLAERWGRWERGFMDRGQQMNQLRTTFSQILIMAGSEEEKNSKIRTLVERFLALRAQQEEAKHQFEADILQNLTPVQQARMILLVEDIQTRIRETLRESRRQGGRL